MSKPEEIFRNMVKIVKQIEAKDELINLEEQSISEDKKNIIKAKQAIEELPKSIERKRKRINEEKDQVKGMKNTLKEYVKNIEDIKKEDEEKGYSPNPLIEKESSEEVYKKAVNFLVVKGIIGDE